MQFRERLKCTLLAFRLDETLGKFIAFCTINTQKLETSSSPLLFFVYLKLLFLYEILSCICAVFFSLLLLLAERNRKENLWEKKAFGLFKDLCKKEMMMKQRRKGNSKFDDLQGEVFLLDEKSSRARVI